MEPSSLPPEKPLLTTPTEERLDTIIRNSMDAVTESFKQRLEHKLGERINAVIVSNNASCVSKGVLSKDPDAEGFYIVTNDYCVARFPISQVNDINLEEDRVYIK